MMQTPAQSKPLPLAIAALDAAHFMAAATQGETALTLQLAELIKQLTDLQPDLMKLAEDGMVLDPDTYGRVMSAFGTASDLIPVTVIVRAEVHMNDLHSDDDEVEGYYQVLVPGYLSDDLQAAVALDHFHDKIGIKRLDDFTIVVAKTLDAPDDYEANTLYKLGDYAGRTESPLA